MARFTNVKKLSKQEQDKLFIRFAQVLSKIKSPVEAANLIRDLFSEGEALMFARRLQIAEFLQSGLTYDEIRKTIKVSKNTIARVKTWLEIYGDGYRALLERAKESTQGKKEEQGNWRNIKRKYPMYFWPQVLLEEVVKSANKREKQRLYAVAATLRDKTKLSKDLLIILNQEYKPENRQKSQ